MPWDCRSRNCELLFTFLRCSFQKHFLLWLIKGGGWEELREREKERDKDKKKKERARKYQRNSFQLAEEQIYSIPRHCTMSFMITSPLNAIKSSFSCQSNKNSIHSRVTAQKDRDLLYPKSDNFLRTRVSRFTVIWTKWWLILTAAHSSKLYSVIWISDSQLC